MRTQPLLTNCPNPPLQCHRDGQRTRSVGHMSLVWFHRITRIGLIGLLAVGAVAVWHWQAAFDPIALTTALARSPAAPLGFLAVHIVASLLFIPRMPLGVVAGILFGAGWGIAWATLGSVAGALAGFLIARYVNGGLIDPARLGSVSALVERGGWRAVTILRLIPVLPHSAANYGLGLTRLPLGAYAFGSLLGQLPMTIAYVDLGAAGESLVLGRAGWIAPAVIGCAILTGSLLIPAIVRRHLHPAPATLGGGPPLAQSRSSTVCTTGTSQAEAS
jgi:uncharacterized membrane protein YdjX (TVP38/TMEM64 family)